MAARLVLSTGLTAPLVRSVPRSGISPRSIKSISLTKATSSVGSTPKYQVSKLIPSVKFSPILKRSFHVTKPTFDMVQFKLADIGEGIAECEILKWHVKEGDKIAQFDLLCEVQSDKATVEITSRYDGVITKMHYKKGDMAKVGSPLVDIEASPEQAREAAAASGGHGHSPATPPPAPSTTSLHESNSKFATTPAVRHYAARHQIDLKTVKGTGRDGRVLKEDILKHVPGAINAAPASQPASPPVHSPVPSPFVPSPTVSAEDRVVPLSGYSRVMVKTMTLANTIPHFGYADEVIVDNLLEFRKDLKKIAETRGIKLTLMPIIIKATSLALKQYPSLNSSYDEGRSSMIFKASHNIGVAVDTPNGLIVPNIKNVQNKSIFEIAQDLNRIIQAALKAAVPKEDLSGGTFSLSNIGSIGGTYTSPVIVPPEVAIGAIGKIQKVPRYDKEDRVVPVHIMNISWSADHRVIDGATMANFSNMWKKYLEHPQTMLLDTK